MLQNVGYFSIISHFYFCLVKWNLLAKVKVDITVNETELKKITFNADFFFSNRITLSCLPNYGSCWVFCSSPSISVVKLLNYFHKKPFKTLMLLHVMWMSTFTSFNQHFFFRLSSDVAHVFRDQFRRQVFNKKYLKNTYECEYSLKIMWTIFLRLNFFFFLNFNSEKSG